MSEQRQTYKGYQILYEPPPVSGRGFDWQYAHDDFDGTGGDMRYGACATAHECREEIDDLEGPHQCDECKEAWEEDGGWYGDGQDGYPDGYRICESCIGEIPNFWIMQGVI